MLKKGYVQVYTGDGKGKTTAAIGLTVRALSAGLHVCIIHFLKRGSGLASDMPPESRLLTKTFSGVNVVCTGGGSFITSAAKSALDEKEAQNGFCEAKKAIDSLKYDIVILDEINAAIKLGLVKLEEALELIESRPQSVELVLTGRDAAPEIIAAADLVTEMAAKKHYYDKGVRARTGIEK